MKRLASCKVSLSFFLFFFLFFSRLDEFAAWSGVAP